MKDAPWIVELRDACKAARSQGVVAEKIGYSQSVVNQVLKGTYKGDLKSVQRAVEGALMGATVDCPILGDLPRQRCIENQRAGFRATNPLRVQLARTCPTCPNFRRSS